MSDIILGLVILVLFIYVFWKERNAEKERKNFINAVIAKNAQEKAQLDVISNQESKVEEKPDLVPVENLTDEEWEKVI